jgi:prepilin-type N-terminal cleavage/methylation domain-containing protein
MKDRRGFTLIEVMIAFAIVGIMAVIAMTNFQSWVYKYNFSGFQREVLSRLKEASTLAVSSQRQHRVVIDLGAGTVTLSRGNAGSGSSWPGTSVRNTLTAPYGVRAGSLTPTPGVAKTTGTFALILNPSREVLAQSDPADDNTIATVTQVDIALAGKNPGDVATIRVYGWTGKARIQ